MPQHHTQGSHRSIPATGIVAALVLAAGCSGDSLTPDPCTGPAAIVTPSTVSFVVGDTVVADLELVGPAQCRPPMLTRNKIRWMALDSTIARISPNKGIMVAKGAGQTNIMAYYPADGSVWGVIPVTVDE
jgi:hypothetical protein